MKWYIITDINGNLTLCNPDGNTREECIQTIEQYFETGDLTREVYIKISPYAWNFRNKFIRLVNEKQLEKLNVSV